jgi:hypothetical protein
MLVFHLLKILFRKLTDRQLKEQKDKHCTKNLMIEQQEPNLWRSGRVAPVVLLLYKIR